MNSKIKSYIIPIIIIIISILVGFSLYSFYDQPFQEGLETRIMREDGKLVKRRKKKVIIREGADFDPDPLHVGDQIKESIENTKKAFERAGDALKQGFKIFDEVAKGFKRMIGFFKMIGRLFEWIGEFFRYLFNFIVRIFNNIGEAFNYIPRVFIWLGSYLTGAVRYIQNLNKCFGWYMLDGLGHFAYSPIKFLFWLFSLQYIEDMLWGYAESIDCMVKKYTGYHLIHYSDEIQDRCYSWCPDEFPRFPDLNWSFDPPTLDTNLDDY
jgi:hypothetical protein